MSEISIRAGERPAEKATVWETTRLFFVDHLRAALIILVVLHHLAVVYAAAAPFYYVDPPPSQSLGALGLFVFVLFNQAWFMSALFLLSGYFTPGSYERKGTASFLKERLIRLGIPLVVYFFVLNPIADMGLFLDPAPLIPLPLTWQSFWQVYPELIGMGPMWFVAMLLVFDFAYAGWQLLGRNRQPIENRAYGPPSLRAIVVFVLVLALVTYLLRIVIPMGREILGFPTLAYLPQYVSFFALGIIACRRDWLRTVTDRMGKMGFLSAVVGTLVLFPIIVLGILGGTFRFLGNGSWTSAIYALWDSLFVVGMSLGAITFFRHYFASESKLGTFLSQQSYAVYIIHSPLIVLLAYWLRVLTLGPVSKFAVAAVIVVPICFVVAYALRKIPGVARVI